MFPSSPVDRLEWAIKESLVIFGIFLFWAGAVLVVGLAIELLLFTFEVVTAASGGRVGGLRELTHRLRGVVVPISGLTAALYVLVRTGTVLIDHYARTVRDRSSTLE